MRRTAATLPARYTIGVQGQSYVIRVFPGQVLYGGVGAISPCTVPIS